MRRLTILCLLPLLLVSGAALAGGDPPKKKQARAGEPAAFPDALRDADWPGDWRTAKAYTYNTASTFGPKSNIFVWRDGTWNENIDTTHDLTREQAEAALELTHRTAGDLRVSKCAFPRHAVVFFDESGEPVGSVNVCFECGDILVWPAYGDEEAADEKYLLTSDAVDEDGVERQLFDLVHEAVMPEWASFFTALGVEASLR